MNHYQSLQTSHKNSDLDGITVHFNNKVRYLLEENKLTTPLPPKKQIRDNAIISGFIHIYQMNFRYLVLCIKKSLESVVTPNLVQVYVHISIKQTSHPTHHSEIGDEY